MFERELAAKKALKSFDAGLSDGSHDPFGYIGKTR